MRITSMFHTFTLLMAILTFSAPFVTLANQNSVQAEAEAAAAQDINPVRLAAKTDAESDASRDINRLACLGIGAGAAVVGGWCGASIVGDSYSDPSWPEVAALVGGLAGGTGIFSALIGSSIYLPNPPPERLIGKSPEYIMSYANAYRTKTRSVRITSAVTGTAIGGGCITLSLGSLLVNQIPTYVELD